MGTRPAMVVRSRTPHARSISSSRCGSATGPTRSRRREGKSTAARATARATVSTRFSRVSRPKHPTTSSSSRMPRACRQAATSPAVTGTRTAGIASWASAVPGIASSIARAMAPLCTAVTRDTATGSWNSG